MLPETTQDQALRNRLDYFETIANERLEAAAKLERRLADMQALCKRAHLILDEHWDNYTEDGYGPSNLLRYLERAADGKEIKDITAYNDQLVKICNKQADRIVELEKELEN